MKKNIFYNLKIIFLLINIFYVNLNIYIIYIYILMNWEVKKSWETFNNYN